MSSSNDGDAKKGKFDFHVFASKGLFDHAFAEKLMKDPEGALKELGIEPTEEILKALDNIDPDPIKDLAKLFGSEQPPQF